MWGRYNVRLTQARKQNRKLHPGTWSPPPSQSDFKIKKGFPPCLPATKLCKSCQYKVNHLNSVNLPKSYQNRKSRFAEIKIWWWAEETQDRRDASEPNVRDHGPRQRGDGSRQGQDRVGGESFSSLLTDRSSTQSPSLWWIWNLCHLQCNIYIWKFSIYFQFGDYIQFWKCTI